MSKIREEFLQKFVTGILGSGIRFGKFNGISFSLILMESELT